MSKEPKDGKPNRNRAAKPESPAPNGEAPDPAAAAPAGKAKTAIDEVIAAIEAARDKVMADEVKSLTKLGIPRAMAYQMVAARFRQTVVTDGEGGQEFESSHWSDR
jgi:hypothetical protein